jgi:hypothetical protein
MTTFLNSGLESVSKRLSEIDLILEAAKENFEKNEELYHALCRSAQVLISAHFEGYIKELVRNSLEDINHFSQFRFANKALKKTLCHYFLVANRDEKYSQVIYNKTQELTEVFSSLSVKFKKEYFQYLDHKNPKASILEKVAEQFGVKDIFRTIKNSNLDLVFSNTYPENLALREKIRAYLLEKTKTYPYEVQLDYLEINHQKVIADNLWDAFLSELLKRRHDIAHGTEIENSVGHALIESDKVKIEILIYAFTSFICLECNPINILEV